MVSQRSILQSIKNTLMWVTLFATFILVVPAAWGDSYQLVLSGTPGVSPIGCGTGSGSCGSFTFTTNVTQTAPNTYEVVFTVENTGKGSPLTYDTAYLQGFGLTLFHGTVSGATVSFNPSLPTGVTASLVDNSKTSNGGANSHCNISQANTGSVCLDVTSSNGINISGSGGMETFDFVLTLASGGSLIVAPDTWHIMANGTTALSGGGNDFALTQDGAPSLLTPPPPPPPPPPVPEPPSFALFGAGLLGLAGIVRRQLR